MDFPFTYTIEVGGWAAAHLEGVLVLEADPVCHPAEDAPSWSIAEVHVNVCRVVGPAGSRVLEQRREELTDEHWLYERLWTTVVNERRHDIDAAWAEYIHGKLAHARRGFTVHADPSV